jgi:hypothetical protein
MKPTRIGFALLDEELDVVQAGLAQQADEEFAEVGRARIAVHEADADRLGAREVACFLVRRIVQGGDRVGDLAPRALAHQAFAIHDARHGHGGYAGQLGHVGHGRLSAPLPRFLDRVGLFVGHGRHCPVRKLSY